MADSDTLQLPLILRICLQATVILYMGLYKMASLKSLMKRGRNGLGREDPTRLPGSYLQEGRRKGERGLGATLERTALGRRGQRSWLEQKEARGSDECGAASYVSGCLEGSTWPKKLDGKVSKGRDVENASPIVAIISSERRVVLLGLEFRVTRQ